MYEGTVESLEALSLIFTMFAEDDKHHLPSAVEAAKMARLKCIEAALAFQKAGNLLKSYKIHPAVENHLKSLNYEHTMKDWLKRGIIAFGSENLKIHTDQKELSKQANLGDLVLGYASKFSLLADYLEWPVQNLLSNRYPFRDTMIQIFSTAAIIIHEAAFLSQLFYELPSKAREEHLALLSQQN